MQENNENIEMTLKEAADYLNVNTWVIRNAIHKGYLPAFRDGPKIIKVEKNNLIKYKNNYRIRQDIVPKNEKMIDISF